MKLYVGIDLGSTTTKAVVMDGDEVILGKGITNSRSNYDTACAIAQNEAFIDTRFSLFRQQMGMSMGELGNLEEFLIGLEAKFRLEQFLRQLDYLKEISLAEADHARNPALKTPLCEKLDQIFAVIAAEAQEWFRPGADKRSDFFRDLAGNAYMRSAEVLAEPDGVTYDMLVNIYDKCIIRVENTMLDLSLEGNIGKALDGAFGQGSFKSNGNGLSDEVKAGIRSTAEQVLDTSLDVVNSVGTGYGRARLPFPKEQIRSEILCHGLGAHFMYPDTATVLDIGGQDTKAIQVDSEGIVTSFQMNDRCAAGCGRYLGYIADELNMGVQELGPLAMQANKSVRINSTCTVFAGAELRERLNNGERQEDILQGLHRAIILRAMSLLARSGGISDEFTFTGGVANNEAAVHALSTLVEENYGKRKLNISANSIYTGAIGAALFALRNVAV
ncbi:MAG: benzoyl-CoA reductase subunit A [bacterium]